MSNNNLAYHTSLHISNLLGTKIFIDCGYYFGVTSHLNYFLLCHCQHILIFINIGILDAVSILILHELRLSGIERANYIESNNLGQKSCPVSGIERIRYSELFITLKIEGKKSGPTKSSGFMGIPVLRGSGLEGFYCILQLYNDTEPLAFKY